MAKHFKNNEKVILCEGKFILTDIEKTQKVAEHKLNLRYIKICILKLHMKECLYWYKSINILLNFNSGAFITNVYKISNKYYFFQIYQHFAGF